MVLLYFELCEQIWGGSPATTTIPSGIETADIDTASHHSDSASTLDISMCLINHLSGEGEIYLMQVWPNHRLLKSA